MTSCSPGLLKSVNCDSLQVVIEDVVKVRNLCTVTIPHIFLSAVPSNDQKLVRDMLR